MCRLIANGCFAYAAWSQAEICADAARHGLAVGLLMLFMCLVANHLVATWLRGDFH